MASWEQSPLHLNTELVPVDMYLVESSTNELEWASVLPIKVRNKLAMSGITTLSQLASMDEQDLMQIKHLGPKALESIKQLLLDSAQASMSVEPVRMDYGPFWRSLVEAHHIPIATISELSPRAINALQKAGISSVALLVLVSSAALLGLSGVGITITGKIQETQSQLAHRLGLSELLGTMPLSLAHEINQRLTGTVLHAKIASSAERALLDLDIISAEMSKGRLSKEFVVSFICGRQAVLTLDHLNAAIESVATRVSVSDETISTYIRNTEKLASVVQVSTIDAEIKNIQALLNERSISILRHRYDPFLPMTLEQVGQLLNLTRERVRQIQVKGVKQLAHYFDKNPSIRIRSAIWTAIRMTGDGASLDEIENELRVHGLIESDDAFPDLLVIWQALDLEYPFIHEQIAASAEGLSAAQIFLRKELRRNINKLCRNSGAVSLQWLPLSVADEDKRAILHSLHYEEIIPGWFWHNITAKNVVESVARKIFSVTEHITPREFRLSLSKHLSRREFVTPPTEVLRQVVLRLDFITEVNGILTTRERFSPADTLNGSERAIYQYILENGPVVPFQGLFEAIQSAGFKTITLAVRLKQSPIIRKVKHGLYALVGAAYTDSDIAHAESTIQETDSDNVLTYNTDGTITYLFNAGPWLLYGGVINAPELHHFSGTWQLKPEGKIIIKKDHIWGLNNVVALLSPQLGERLAIHLDTRNQTATVERVGTDDETNS